MTLDTNTSQRIMILNFILIAGVVFLHTPSYVPMAEVTNTPFALFKAFIQNAVFRTTVPMMACISGYLLFQAGTVFTAPVAMLKKKLCTIGVPFLVFNLSLLAAAYVAQKQFGITMSVDLVHADTAALLDTAFGVQSAPINYPLHYLRDLLVVLFLSPLMGVMLRHVPYLGLVAVLYLFIGNVDGPVVRSGEIAVMFYLGGLAAVRNWNLRALDHCAVVAFVLFLVICAHVVATRTESTTWLQLASPFLLWPASALLQGTRFGEYCARMSKYSFFIYIAHAPVLFATWFVYHKVQHILPYELYWAIAPVVTIAIMVTLFCACNTFMPRLFAVVLGGRAAPRACSRIKTFSV
jgi:succinoglycan biosynthesis protein ExoH